MRIIPLFYQLRITPIYLSMLYMFGCGDPNPATNFLEEEGSRKVEVSFDASTEEVILDREIASDDDADGLLDSLYGESSVDAIASEDVLAERSSVGSGSNGNLGSDSGALGIEEGVAVAGSSTAAGYEGGEEGWLEKDQEQARKDAGLSVGEIKACASLHGVDYKYLKVVGKESKLSLSASSVVVAKLSGNAPGLELNLGHSEPIRISGACFFVTGNQGKLNLNLTNVTLDFLAYIGRGNKSQGIANVDEGSAISHALIDLKGNQSNFSFTGAGDYSCNAAYLKGNKAGVTCN